MTTQPKPPVWRGTLQRGPGAEPLAHPPPIRVRGWPKLAEAVATRLQPTTTLLVHADDQAPPEAVMQDCQAFAEAPRPGGDALIVIVLRGEAPGLEHFARHAANAVLWAYTQEAALAWAARHVRVNAIGLGASPSRPFAPGDQAGPSRIRPATLDEVAATVAAMARWPSMTGQIIRLG